MHVYYMSWIGVVLISIILIRAFASHLFGQFPIFYSYLAFVAAQSVARFYILMTRPEAYARFYWLTELAGSLLGCALIWEIYCVAFEQYPGASRVANTMLLITLGAMLLGAFILGGSPVALDEAAAFERNLRIAQGILLFVLVGILFHYTIPVGRSLRGVIGGYTLYVGTSIISLGIRFLTHHDPEIRPAAYAAALGIWTITLWSAAPRLSERGKGSTTAQTNDALRRMTSRTISVAIRNILKGARP